MNLYFRNLIEYTQEFGFFLAFLLIIQRKLKCKTIRIKPKGIKHWIQCRNGTSDFAVLRQVIGKKECAFDLKQVPTNIIDAGANVGYASILFANIWKNANIVAIEPEEGNFKMLLKNTAPYPNIKCLRAAVWSWETTLNLKNAESLPFSYQYEDAKSSKRSDFLVEAVTIRGICEKFSIDRIDLLKIDIEGAEFELFKNAEPNWHLDAENIAVELHEWIVPGVEKNVLEKMKDRTTLLSGYKSNNSIWLGVEVSSFWKSCFISNSCKAIFSNG